MPIRINLLAEAQALEDMRRRDPVKRAILAGVGITVVILAWSSSLQLKSLMARNDLAKIEAQLWARTNEFRTVLESQRKLSEVSHKLTSLQMLATNRLLHGTLLSALQQATVDDVQLVRFRAEQSFQLTEEVKPKTNSNDQVVPGKPATATERVLLTLEARDSGPTPGDQVNKFKQAVTDCPYFQTSLGKSNEVRLASMSPPTLAGPDGKSFVTFVLECRYPEKTR
jgi:hypothetical protein